MFGRLAPGVSFQQAQAELTTIGQRTASDIPRSTVAFGPWCSRTRTDTPA